MDPISDMLIRIKNAALAGRHAVSIPYSKMKFAIAELLDREGFVVIAGRRDRAIGRAERIDIKLVKDDSSRPSLRGVQRISKPSRRVYEGVRSLRPVKNGLGRLVVSTPRGIMTGEEARKAGIGGEVLFKIW